VKVAAVQMNSQTEVGRNLAEARRLVGDAAHLGAQLVVLPENFSFLGAQDSDRVAVAERMGRGAAQEFLAEQAHEHRIWLVGGTIPVLDSGTRPQQRSMLFSPEGVMVAHYDKLHLFDVVIPNNETESYRESAMTLPGDGPVVAETDVGRIGMTVCYDLRFPALLHRLGTMRMDILVVPAAFTVPTGRVHWQPLLQTRAFESLVYVVASGQWGEHAGGRLTYGHSSVVSPWGDILATLDSGTGVVCADVDFDTMRELREKFPVLEHRREF
jgi:predicted amidohydrolase